MAYEFKPNIYPIIFWALAFGLAAGFLLFIVNILSQYVTLVWFPVFLAGLIWGGWRNYQVQRKAWEEGASVTPEVQSMQSQIRQAVTDIADASRELFNQEEEGEPQQPDQMVADEQTDEPKDNNLSQ